jgi:excisionase family DNA binding protein
VAYSIDQACRLTGLGRTLLYGVIKRGDLRARKCGTRTVILAEDLHKFLNNLPEAGSP